MRCFRGYRVSETDCTLEGSTVVAADGGVQDASATDASADVLVRQASRATNSAVVKTIDGAIASMSHGKHCVLYTNAGAVCEDVAQ